MKLRVLMAEDNPDDVELVLEELRQAGYDCEWQRVDGPEAFREALDNGVWNIVLADFNMPRFTAPAALEILKSSGKDIPFVIVSGSVGEDVAVQAMRAGAHDFFAKTNLARLGAAIEREIREFENRQDRRHALAQLRHVEERYRLIVESVRDYAIFMLDANGVVVSWNAGAERLTGYAEAEIVGKPLSSFLLKEERAGVSEDALRRAREHGSFVGEGRSIRRDGEQFWALFTLDRIVTNGRIFGYSAIVRDITEKKQLLDDLQQAVHARDEFLSIASHELKTPLTSMELQLERLKKVRRTTPEVRLADDKVAEKLDMVERQAERLTILINNLLDVTRITNGRMDLRCERLDLGQLAQSVVSRACDSIGRGRCQVRIQDDVVGEWDRLRLETAIANLLSNALKYGAGKPVDVVVEGDASHARVRVTDRGIGISREQQDRIFERFERAVPEQHYGGFGLGLWIVRQVAEAHGGTVHVDSRMNEGSTFTVELPIYEEKRR